MLVSSLAGQCCLAVAGQTLTYLTGHRFEPPDSWCVMSNVSLSKTESISSMLKLLCEAAAGAIIWDGSHKDGVHESRWGGPARSPDSHSRNSTAHERQWLKYNTTQHNTGGTCPSPQLNHHLLMQHFVSTRGIHWLTCVRVCAVSGEEVSPSAHDNLHCHEPD